MLAAVLALHGLIHLIGVAKAFGLAELPALTQSIRPFTGVLWLLAGLLFLAAAAGLYLWPRWWWVPAALGLLVSAWPLVESWPDTRAGVILALVLLAACVVGFRMSGPGSLRARFERDARAVLEASGDKNAVLREADLRDLPAPVQRYVHLTGAVGQPRVRTFVARMHGRIRNGPDGRWMPFRVEQVSSVEPPARLFYMDASLAALPVHGLHRYAGDAATMRVLLAGLVPVADQAGDEMTRAETVTLLNDLFILAPGALTARALQWTPIDDRRARVALTHAGHTVSAELVFDADGALVDFESDDRLATSADGSRLVPMRWSTPMRDYRAFGPVRLPSRGEGRWHAPGGAYTYIDLTIDEVRYNADADWVERR